MASNVSFAHHLSFSIRRWRGTNTLSFDFLHIHMPGGISSVCLAQARSLLVATFWPPTCNYIRQCCCFIFNNTAIVLAVEESSAVESLSVVKELVLTLTAKAIDTSDCCYSLLTLGWRVTGSRFAVRSYHATESSAHFFAPVKVWTG